MNIYNTGLDTHAMLMKMMDKVNETSKRNFKLQKEEMEKRAEMKATEKNLSFSEMLKGSINSKQNTTQEINGKGSEGVDIALNPFPKNYFEHPMLTQIKDNTVN